MQEGAAVARDSSQLSAAPQCSETHFSSSPGASVHFISWLNAEQYILSVQNLG